MSAATAAVRDGDGTAANWDVTTTLTWLEYKTWIGSAAGTVYRQSGPQESHVSYVRRLPGDLLLVDVTVVSPGPPLRLRVSFSAHPD